MQEVASFNWLQATPTNARPVDIKVESTVAEQSVFSLLSPPSSPSRSFPDVTTVTSNLSAVPATRRRSNTSALTSPKRVKPYPASRSRDDSMTMADPSSYAVWTSTRSAPAKSLFSTEPILPRRSSDGDQQLPSYPAPESFISHSFMGRPHDRDIRPQSSSSSLTTSSLTGAMGDAQLSNYSDSPSPTSDRRFSVDIHAGTVWHQSSAAETAQGMAGTPDGNSSYNSGLPGHTGNSMPYQALSSAAAPSYVSYADFGPSSTYHDPAPHSVSPPSPTSAFASSSYNEQQPGFSTTRASLPLQSRPGNHGVQNTSESFTDPNAMNISHVSSNLLARGGPVTADKYDEETMYLRKHIRDLELVNESARRRIRQLETELSLDIPNSHTHPSASSSPGTGLPSPLSTPSPQSASFHVSWKARTDARVRLFCSLNRAGNALCAWHDSRRERRAHPPRMAPPGHLNCGCTYEEALFEESLARHGVGSYHPGETVRMDPALRNPLLKLLQQRYGYRDGDFERDAASGNWLEGEGPAYWEGRALSGGPHARKSRMDVDRR